MSLNAISAGEMGRACDGFSPAEGAEDAEETLLRRGGSAKPNLHGAQASARTWRRRKLFSVDSRDETIGCMKKVWRRSHE